MLTTDGVRMQRLIVFLVLFALNGCISLKYHDHPPDIQPMPDKALVYFIEGADLIAGLGFEVRDGDVVIGGLEAGVYFHAFIEPGEHLFSLVATSGNVVSTIRGNYNEGRTYYISNNTGTYTIQEVPESTGKDMVKRSRYATLK